MSTSSIASTWRNVAIAASAFDEHFLFDLRRAEQELLALLDVRQHLALALQDVDELGPIARALVDRLDRGRGFDGLRRRLEHALVGLDGAVVVAQLVLLDLSAAEQERDLEVVFLRFVRDLIVERGDLGPLVEATGQAIELGVRGLVARILAHGARERRERGVRVVATDLVQLGDHVEQLDLARRIEGVLRHDLVHADLLGPLAASLVDRLEDVRDRELVLGVARSGARGPCTASRF